MKSSDEKSKAPLTLRETGSRRSAVGTCVHMLSQFDFLYETQHVLDDLFKL